MNPHFSRFKRVLIFTYLLFLHANFTKDASVHALFRFTADSQLSWFFEGENAIFQQKMETRFLKNQIYFLSFHSKSVNPLTKKLENAILHIFDSIECSFIVKIQFTMNF